MKSLLVVGISLLLAVAGVAQVGNTVSGSYGSISASCSVSYNATAGTVTFSSTSTGGSGGNAVTVYYQTASALGVYSATLGSNGGGSGAHSATYSIANGSWVRMWLYFSGPAEPAGWHAYEMYYKAIATTGNATKHKSKLVEFKNTTEFKIKYVVKDASGRVTDTFYVNPGETYYRQFQRNSTDTGQWTITPHIVGATMGTDGVLSYTGSGTDEVEMLPSDFIPASDFTAGSNPGISSTSVTAPTISVDPLTPPPPAPASGGPSERNQYRGSVVYSGTSGATDTDALRTGDFKEGVDQIVGELKKANETLQSAEARHVEGQKSADTQKANGKATSDTKAAEAKAAFESAVPSQSTIGTGATQSSSLFSLAVPKGKGAHRAVNLDPNVLDGIDDVLPWIRSVIALFVAGWFTWWAYGELSIFIMGMQALQPARGNTIAGSGGQATSLIVAGWTTLIVTAAPTAIVALWTGAPLLSTVGGGTIDLFGGAPSGAAQAGVYLIYSLLPMATIATALTSMFVIRKAGPAIYMGVAAAVRWCVA